MYDIGQRVRTPSGQAIVLGATSYLVSTDRGTFLPDQVAPYIDAEALRDPEVLEAWLEEEESAGRGDVVGVAVACACACGSAGDCHRVVHYNRAHGTQVGVGHTSTTSACRCVLTECPCLI